MYILIEIKHTVRCYPIRNRSKERDPRSHSVRKRSEISRLLVQAGCVREAHSASGHQDEATTAAAEEAGNHPGNGDHPEREQVQGFIAVALAVRGLVPHHSLNRINPDISYQENNGHI